MRRAGQVAVFSLSVAAFLLSGAFSVTANLVTTATGFGPYRVEGGEMTLLADAEVSSLLGSYSPLASGLTGPPSFQTFCVERDELIYPGRTYEVTFNNVTMFSGVQLTIGTAYLYQQFATGNLNYDYANSPAGSRTVDGVHNAYYLAHAIWHYMGQYSAEPGNPYEQLVNSLYGAAAYDPDNSAHGVKVVNLWAPGQFHDPSHAYQDVLIYAPVPEASTIIPGATLVGLLICSAVRRHKSRVNRGVRTTT